MSWNSIKKKLDKHYHHGGWLENLSENCKEDKGLLLNIRYSLNEYDSAKVDTPNCTKAYTLRSYELIL